ncbi:MAG: polysaccharide pyruvyl transferase family protein [Deltaproteobacteria bacterium]|nr:polysaccharide pyruvyl transferase family protein [Deltaproteobacteria bacterium]
MNKQIIFLNRTNEHNTGDMLSSVYYYLHNDFIGKGIEMIWLDIEKHDPTDRTLEDKRYNPRNRAVIVGGGGLLNLCHPWSQRLVTALDHATTAILGTGGNDMGLNDPVRPPFYRAVILGRRDFPLDSPLWCPCFSVLADADFSPRDIEHEIGLGARFDQPVPEGVSTDGSYTQSNYPYQDIIDYLMRCRFVVSNSYHLLYWAALLGKPTAVYPSINSSKWYTCPWVKGDYPVWNPDNPVFATPVEDFRELCRQRAQDYRQRTLEFLLKIWLPA